MFQYDSIEDALEALRQGHLILCTDDPDRENEGDLIWCSPVCNHWEHQFYGHPCQGADLYAHVGRICPKAPAPADGGRQYG